MSSLHTKNATINCCSALVCPIIKQFSANRPDMSKNKSSLEICKEMPYTGKTTKECCLRGNTNRVNDYTNSNNTFNKGNCDFLNSSGNVPQLTVNDQGALIKFNVTGESGNVLQKAVSNFTMSQSLKPETANSESPTPQLKQNKIGYRNNTKSSFSESADLQFLEIPKGDDMRIHDVRLDEEHLLFEVFSELMVYLQPSGFPSDLLRQAMYNHVPIQLLAFQMLKLDIAAIVWMFVWGIASLCLPVAVFINICCSKNIRRLNEEYSIGPVSNGERWTGRALGISLHVLLVLLLSPIFLILAGNEQISRSISKSPASATLIYEDINTFLRNTHMQIAFVVTSSTDIAVEEIRKDLEAVNELLGKPYQQELDAETGIEAALIELDDLRVSTAKVTSLVADLVNDCDSARIATTLLQDQLNDIARQLNMLRQQCSLQDRPLCFTLQYYGFETSFSVDNLTNDSKIQHLRHLHIDKHFNSSIEAARKTFSAIPEQISSEAERYITDMKAVLSRKRTEVYKSTHALDVLTRALSETVERGREVSSTLVQNLADWDLWRWLAVLGLASVLFIIWGLLLCGAPCGCGLTSRTIPLLLAGVSLSCLTCLFVWGVGSLSLLIAGHGQCMICDPVYDHPRYEVLGKLLDSGGILYDDGLLEEFAAGNDTVEVGDVLKNCQRNQPAYHTFHLYNTIDIERIFNYKNWSEMDNISSTFMIGECTLEILSPALQLSLQGLLTDTSVNLTNHRLQASSPVTKRDLNSFADQLNTVARQLSDAPSARKFDSLAFNVRKIVQHEFHTLNQFRDGIQYKLTTLEVLLKLLNKKVDQLFANLKRIQYFLDNQGRAISERIHQRFTSRINTHLDELYSYVKNKVLNEVGKCRPLWELFHFGRFNFCKLVMDPLSGIALLSFFSILLLLTIAPVVIKLIDHYREVDDVTPSSSHRNEFLMDDDGVWVTPSSESPTDIQLRERTPPEEQVRPTTSTWISPTPPRQPSPRRIPPPPRGRRNHESLKLVEPVTWKVGSTTPKSWI
ncbi:prominin isoform X2 [Leptinotarsa decemlineata]|uniref:prominin isoform X2 n=1 Tax=Leptinotarsa decemlineata TaxID=7539 RepID=UPI003D30CDCA